MVKLDKSLLQGSDVFGDIVIDSDTSVLSGPAIAQSFVTLFGGAPEVGAPGNTVTAPATQAASLLSAADPNVASASAGGNAVSLDTDNSLKPSLSVDATNPAHVTFTVSGLESDYSGTVTFTDVSGSQDVVPIESNGTYSTNLSNLANGTITYLLSVSDPAGNVITVDPPLNLGDGSANAPAGTPQLPTLLSGYAVRPSWNVAGVDYNVGVPAGTVLKDPTTISMAGVSVNATSHLVTVTGNNVTLNGYDFSLNGGWQVDVNGANDTIENSNFQVGTNLQQPLSIGGSASNTTIIYNNINGAGLLNSYIGYGLIEASGTGTTTIEYNSVENAYSEDMVIGNDSSSTANYVIQYNLVENAGYGFANGAHGDWLQEFNGPGGSINNLQINFNTFVQTVAPGGGATQGLSLQSANISQGPVLSESVSNNTMVATGSNTVSYAIIIDTTNLNGTATVSNNYVVPTGIAYGLSFYGKYNGGNSNEGVYNGTVTTFNNINAVTGTPYAQDVTSVTKVVSSPSTGTEFPGNTITLTLDFSAAVTVSGTPTLTFNDGGTATYTGGSGTSALTFRYTVGASDSAVPNLAITQVNLPNGATIKDTGGNAANLTSALTTLWGLQIDPPSGPTLSSVVESPSSGDLNAGKTVTLTVNLSEAVNVNTTGGAPTLTLNDGGTATYTGGNGTNALTFSYTVAAGQTTASLAATAVNLNGATIQDGSGNAANLSVTGLTQTGPQIDTTTPTVSSVATSGTGITAGAGDLTTGNVVTLTVNLSEAVNVNTTGGTPTLTLNDGGTATYTGGTGTNALTFSYTVAAGQNTADLAVTAVNLNSATVTDGAGNAANLTGAVTNPAGTLQIDTTTTRVSSVTTSGTGITAGGGDLGAGSVVTLTVNLSEAVTVNTTGGTPTLMLNDGGTATYTGGTGTNALTFSYTVAAGQSTADLAVTAVNLNSATVTDGAGNAANLTGAVTNPAGTLQIGTAVPVISAIAESPSSGDLNAGKIVTYTISLSEAVTVNTTSGSPTLALNDGGTATYVSGSGTNALTFSYTVLPGQNTPDLMVSAVNLNNATIKDGAGNAANLSLTGVAQGSPAIDTTSPTVASVTAPAGDYNAGNTLTLTLNMSEAVNVTGTPTLTLNDGGSATYVSGSGTNALTFSYTVAAGQNTADLAVTAVNLNSATIKDGAGNAANLTGAVTNPAGILQIDTTVPAAPIMVSENVIGNRVVLTGTAVAGDVVGIYDGTTLLGTTSSSSTGNWVFETPSETNGAHTFTATATDTAGDVSALSNAIDPDVGEGPVVNAAPVEVGNKYYLYNSSGSDVALTYAGAVVTAGEFGGWTPIGAVQTASGYDVAWKMTGANEYTVWATNSSGNAISNLTGPVSGTSYALESLESTFNQDLNSDGVIGLTTTVIQVDGSTSLTEVANRFYLDGIGGSGPALQYAGADVTAGEFGGWTPIGAVQTASGYDVAWKMTGANEYTVWVTNSSGNAISNLTGPVSGTSTALESLESTFNQDLNGDGVIGLYAAPGSTLQISNPLAGTSATIGTGATLELAGADTGSVTFASSKGTLVLDHSSTFSGQIFGFTGDGTLSGSDQIDLKDINFNSVQDAYANGVLTVTDGSDTATLKFNGSYTGANFKFASDGKGGTIVYDPPAPMSYASTPGPATIETSATLESAAAVPGSLALSGFSENQLFAQPSTFTGAASGFGANDAIDLPAIAFDAQTTLGYLPDCNSTGGTQPLTEGSHSANIALLSNYMASSFAVANNNNGSTMVATEASQAGNESLLTISKHT